MASLFNFVKYILDRYPVPTTSLLVGIATTIAVPYTALWRQMAGADTHFFNLRRDEPEYLHHKNVALYREIRNEVRNEADKWLEKKQG